jgi:hypothetical protein
VVLDLAVKFFYLVVNFDEAFARGVRNSVFHGTRSWREPDKSLCQLDMRWPDRVMNSIFVARACRELEVSLPGLAV